MPSAQNRLADAAVGHEIDMTRYGNGVVRRIIALLNRTDADLHAQLIQALDRLPDGGFSVERLDAVLREVRAMLASAYRDSGVVLDAEIQAVAEQEIAFQRSLLSAVLPVEVSFAAISPELVYAAAMSRPFQGRLLSEWMDGLSQQAAFRVRDTIRMGMIEGQPLSQIVSRIRGTKANGYADGFLEVGRRDMEAVVLTATKHTATTARSMIYAANADIVVSEMWLSVLDGRTTPICRARSGKRYPVGKGPMPPAHWRCRSIRVPMLDSDPMTGTQSSEGGYVPANWTYNDWLKRQDTARQDDILGPARAKLFREGLGVDKFVDNRGNTLTLAELKRKNREVFTRAGMA